eukprot:12093359-Prorocentrum_lima.AAC.1
MERKVIETAMCDPQILAHRLDGDNGKKNEKGAVDGSSHDRSPNDQGDKAGLRDYVVVVRVPLTYEELTETVKELTSCGRQRQ